MTEVTDTPVRPQADVRGRMSAEKMAQNRSEEPELIKAWQEDGCAQSLTLLIKRYGPMIGSQIQKILAGRSVGIAHRPDLEQEANIAFIQAVSNFNPDYGTPLSSFAMSHIRKTLLRYALDFRHSYRIGTSSSERKAFYAALAMRADRVHLQIALHQLPLSAGRAAVHDAAQDGGAAVSDLGHGLSLGSGVA